MATAGMLPSGLSACSSMPELLFLPEFILGGVVWILVACTDVLPHNPQAYVLAVSLYCFVATLLWMIVFYCGIHHNRSAWAIADVLYHGFASLLYISASVLLAYITIAIRGAIDHPVLSLTYNIKHYRLDVAAVVFSFVTTLLYVIHTIFSGMRWRYY